VRRGPGKSSLSDETTAGKFEAFVQSIHDDGGTAQAFFASGTDPDQVAELIKKIETEVGPIHVAIYNIGAQVGNRTLEKTSYRIFNLALSMGAVGAFALTKEVSPYMIERGHGTIIFTSATAAYRGNAGQHAHTAAMGARRNLVQSFNAELAPKGIHCCHVNMDGPVDAPETIGKMMPEMFEKMLETKKPNGTYCYITVLLLYNGTIAI
jgi:NAD(P)-dependent dehydrogenase (short-subunit alcohol dehydrogenase family)